MLTNLLCQCENICGKRSSLKRRSDWQRIGKLQTWLEIRTELHFRRSRKLVRIRQLLLQAKSDLTGSAQGSF